jgi:hypothetical protein
MSVETLVFFGLVALGLGALIGGAIWAHKRATSNKGKVEWPPPGV